MAALGSRKIRHVWQVPPLLKTKLFEQVNTGSVVIKQDCDQRFQRHARRFTKGMGQKARGHAASLAVLVHVVTDLCRETQRHPARAVRTQTTPTDYSLLLHRDIERVLVRRVAMEPL